ncbi:DUF1003 domain-containing protein [bacterium]|nr:DUF1003 domain-containing protein [bacterium]
MSFLDTELLKQASLFSSLADKEIKELAFLFMESVCSEGETLFEFGDTGDTLYLLVSGHVELSVRDHTGQKVILKVANPGDLFGELSLMDGGPRTATATALEDCVLASLTHDNFIAFLQRKPEAALDLLSVLAGQIRQANDLVRGRVARNANDEAIEDFTRGQKLANFISDFSGSMPFLFLNALFFTAWVIVNLDLIPGIPAFDPYPFGFLTMAVSLEAIFLSIFVLLSQNIQAAKDKIRSDIEYEVNLKAELEITYLHEKVDRMNDEILKLLRKKK